MQDFKKLDVWRKAHQLTVSLYVETRNFPKEELFGLTGQIRRAAASIGANIAEGCGRGSSADLVRFLQIAFGSASELQYHLLLAKDVGILGSAVHGNFEKETVATKRMLTGLIASIRPQLTTDNRKPTTRNKFNAN
jgi:four helix bundle protein